MSSQEDIKYQKKYLKYKNKFLSLRDKNLNIFDELENSKNFQTSNKNKYLALEEELEQNGGGKWDAFKSAAKKGASAAKSAAKSGVTVAKNVASNPNVQAAALNTATTVATVAAQDPTVQAKLSQAQQYYANSPNAQLAAQIAMSHPKVQSAMSHPAAQQVAQQAKTIASTIPSSNGQQNPQNPDSVWNTLSLEQKKKLISLIPSI